MSGIEPFPVAKALLRLDGSILDAIRIIDTASVQIALATSEEGILEGVVTDGDVRRAILRGLDLSAPIGEILNRSPVVARRSATREEMAALVRAHPRLLRVPVVDEAGRVVDLLCVEEAALRPHQTCPVVLMAGGIGSRLRPYTDTMPKPLLKVGDRPILEHIVRRFVAQGFTQIFISVNYMREAIKDYFGDGSAFGAQIEYVEENERLGTAGSLRLLPPDLAGQIMVMNGDLLTATNFGSLLDYHLEVGARATMCLREYKVQVPYGVVVQEEGRLREFREKPEHKHFVNAGIYVLDASALKLLPPSGYFDMPSLFDRIGEGAQGLDDVAVFPLREYWRDIGKIDDLEQARKDIYELHVLQD